MLVLKRRPQQEIVIRHGDDEISIFLLQINDHAAKIGIDAPDDYLIDRAELLEYEE